MKRLFFALALILGASISTAATLPATPASWAATLTAAMPGDTIVLAGSFGKVTVPPRNYSPPLVIDASAATIAGTRINNVDGVIWRGGEHNAPGGYGSLTKPPVADAGYAITVLGSKNVRIEDITATKARLGVLISNSVNVTLAGSTLTGLGEDGVRATYNQNLTIVGNRIVDFAPTYTGSHPDAAQLYANKGVIVAYNTVSGAFQGLDDFGGTADPFNDGVLVIGNTVRVANYFHGITFTSSNNVTIIGNDVGALPGWARTVTIRAPIDAMQCGNVGPVSAAAKLKC